MRPCLIVLFACLAGPAHAEWTDLIVRNAAVAAVSKTEVRVSQDGGRSFRALAGAPVSAVALGRGQTWVGRADGVLRFARSGGLQNVALPADAHPVRQLAVGPDWLLAVPEHEQHVLVHRGRGWRPILGMTGRTQFVEIDPAGHTLASWMTTAGCGGVDAGPGGIWRPDGQAKPIPDGHQFWELPTGNHRDWLLGHCGELPATAVETDYCLYPPSRRSIPIEIDSPSGLRVSPRARWVGIQTYSDEVHVFERRGRTVRRLAVIPGTLVSARRDGVTVRTAEQRLVRATTTIADLGALPTGTTHVDVDPRGRYYALTASTLWRSGARGWSRLPDFEAPAPVPTRHKARD